ncbi:ABC transporter permease [Breoghania sp.]|uniref:ABC transporter permease n=1 Tax=Breoghania sp. TaxID=2065378 RepID=UPI0026112FEC|nr:ABC transporter permease [Breoghania sp.]MDJ0929766.1 ABC transporter permease [Breoghania sp.]
MKKIVQLADRFAPFLAVFVVLGVWQAATWIFPIPSFLLLSPTRIVSAGLNVDWVIWYGHIWSTLRVAVMGYALAIAVAIPLAVGLAMSRLLSRTLYPMLVVIQSTPIVAVAPIIVVTLGAGDMPKVVITFLITFFPIVASTTTGLLATPEELIELSRSLRAVRTREIFHIQLPFALSFLFSALKILTTLAVIGVVVAEFVAAEKGLGFFIAFSTSLFQNPASLLGAGDSGSPAADVVPHRRFRPEAFCALVAAEIRKIIPCPYSMNPAMRNSCAVPLPWPRKPGKGAIIPSGAFS